MSNLILDTEKQPPIELVGGKAKGLFILKSLEERLNQEACLSVESTIPRFFVIPPALNVSDNEREILETASSLNAETYAVRSSSVLEDNGEHSFDGIFDTCLNVRRDRLLEAVSQVRKSAISDKAQNYAQEVGIKLREEMPVIVQAMVSEKEHTGVVYSKFPAPKDIVKVIRESQDRGTSVEAFLRNQDTTEKMPTGISNPILVSADYFDSGKNEEVKSLAQISLFVEREMKHPVIMEFATCLQPNKKKYWQINLLQARRLTKLSEAERFQMPELQHKGLIASTHNVNGVGDFTGKSYVISNYSYTPDSIYLENLEEFDKRHKEGYVFVTPFLRWYNWDLDSCTPNKKAVVAYSRLTKHHDMELARKKGILLFDVVGCLGHPFYLSAEKKKRAPIETGEIVRVVSDGIRGFVYNLSRD